MNRLVELLLDFPEDGGLDPAYEYELKMSVYRMWLNGAFDRRGHDEIRYIVK